MNQNPKALLSDDVYNFVKENAEELDKAIDYKRPLLSIAGYCRSCCVLPFLLPETDWENGTIWINMVHVFTRFHIFSRVVN